MSYPPPPGGFPMYGPPPVPSRGGQYPTPGGPALGFDNYTSQPPMGAPGVSTGFGNMFLFIGNFRIEEEYEMMCTSTLFKI